MTPILVTGAGRSGTTFLMRLLASHPAVQADEAYPLEFRPFLLSLFPDDPTCQGSTLFRLPGNRALATKQVLELYHSAAATIADVYRSTASTLYYEHLMDERARATLAKLFAWLGIAADEDTISGVLGRARSDTVNEHRTKLSDAATVGRWRYEMPVSVMRLYRDEMGEMLVAMGYPLKAEFP